MVEDFLARRNRLRQRFDDEKVGVANLQFEAAKLFKPITTTQQETHKQASELNKLPDALQRLPARIVDETNYNPIAALFDGEETTRATPTPALLNHGCCRQLQMRPHPVQV